MHRTIENMCCNSYQRAEPVDEDGCFLCQVVLQSLCCIPKLDAAASYTTGPVSANNSDLLLSKG